MFALPILDEDSKIVISGKRESTSHIDMTLNSLRTFGIKVSETTDGYNISGKQKYRAPGVVSVEGDWSNSAFWLCAAALGTPISVTGLDPESLQKDKEVTGILEILKKDMKKAMIDAGNIPDLLPALSVVAATQDKTTVFYNVSRAQLKESNRIDTTCAMLKALGASVTPTEDGLRIKGNRSSLHSATVDSGGDHRIAMAAAIASVTAGNVTILGCETVNRSYPGFFEDFRRLGGTIITNEK